MGKNGALQHSVSEMLVDQKLSYRKMGWIGSVVIVLGIAVQIDFCNFRDMRYIITLTKFNLS